MRTHLIMTIGLLGALCAASAVQAQSATGKRPNPPQQICIDANCVTASTTPSGSKTPVGSGHVKWNPGHYMASYTTLFPGDTLAKIQGELGDLAGWDNIVGYRALTTWGALEPAPGKYDFSTLDALLNHLRTAYSKPKHLVLVVLPGRFGGALGSSDGRAVPLHIQSGAAYGASPVAGSYGWWNKDSTEGSSAGYVAALFRPAVMDQYIALVRALGARYDGDPNFEGIMFQEGSWMLGLYKNAPDYTKEANIAQLKRMLLAATSAFPRTNVIMQNTWLEDPASTQDFELWMVNNRIAPSSADTVGQSAFALGRGDSWGIQAYMGVVAKGSTYAGGDLRPRARAMMDVEGPDIMGNYFAKWGGPFTPADVVTALNQSYQASHAFWTHLSGPEGARGGGTVSQTAPAAVWSSLAGYVNSHPLVHTNYPESYP
jgi:hypothetical protein